MLRVSSSKGPQRGLPRFGLPLPHCAPFTRPSTMSTRTVLTGAIPTPSIFISTSSSHRHTRATQKVGESPTERKKLSVSNLEREMTRVSKPQNCHESHPGLPTPPSLPRPKQKQGPSNEDQQGLSAKSALDSGSQSGGERANSPGWRVAFVSG